MLSVDTRPTIVQIIERYTQEHGYAPTIRELAKLYGYSLAATHEHLATCKRLGYVTWEPHANRTLRVLP